MDYPFYLLKLTQLPLELLAQVQQLYNERNIIAHPHFPTKERNPGTFRLDDPHIAQIVELITTFLDPFIEKSRLYWNEINLIAPKGVLGEHSDLAYAGYNRQKGNPQEIVLTHKIHVHISGESRLSFRRSKYEPVTTISPDVGGCYWYNNYVLHSSHNPSKDVNRVALSLIYHDPKWDLRFKLFNEQGFLFQKSYQL